MFALCFLTDALVYVCTNLAYFLYQSVLYVFHQRTFVLYLKISSGINHNWIPTKVSIAYLLYLDGIFVNLET